MSGRTTWFARDAAKHRRELVVELGEEHGAAVLAVLDVLDAWAQEQRSGGAVRGGFRTLARESFASVDECRRIVEHAARIGALDDLHVDADGRRFTLRVSGWAADQERGRAAIEARWEALRDRLKEQRARERGRVTRRVRSVVLARGGGCCAHCASTAELQIDHIHPIARGGTSDLANLQVLCGPCNRAKGAS